MLGFVFVIISVLVGYEVTEELFSVQKAGNAFRVQRLWVRLPAAYGVGTLLVTWGVYISAWIAKCVFQQDSPLLWGNLTVWILCEVYLIVCYKNRFRRSRIRRDVLRRKFKMIVGQRDFMKECIYFGVLALFLTWIMFYVFYVSDHYLFSGVTVFGDYAPHTAMMRSFSAGNNFPTQYPHFGGEDVKYHFMFQFLTGNLEYLGLRMDLAYNLVSILSLEGFLMVLYEIVRRIGGGFSAAVLTITMFFFRSGTAFFQYVLEHLRAGDLKAALAENTSFIGYTTNENWGLWNFNVYLNQRHLAFGLLIGAVAVWLYLEWLESVDWTSRKGAAWWKSRLFSKEAWSSRHMTSAVLLGMILGLTSFWNGAALIGTLLILLGFAVFSNGKTDYAITAFAAVLFSILQTKVFIRGNAVDPALRIGFLADQPTIMGMLRYLGMISGFFFLGIIILGFFEKTRNRVILFSFCLPVLFAFTVSLTPDIAVNHKYIMIAYAFAAVFWGMALEKLFRKRLFARLAACLLLLCLIATGLYDFVIIVRANRPGMQVTVDLDSTLTRWLEENLDSDDLILTPEYALNEVTISGAMLYCGWPYYAWSAGYDTYYRAAKAVEIYQTEDAEALRFLVEAEGITHILYEEDSQFEGEICKEETIKDTYPLVYTSDDGRIRIYEAK
ncbi:MAG: hypothetical protein HUJ72_01315 [Blautia sp.]|nr:hypothetical protein [Blautia sp.]